MRKLEEFIKMFAICLQTYKSLTNKLKNCNKSVNLTGLFFVENILIYLFKKDIRDVYGIIYIGVDNKDKYINNAINRFSGNVR